MEWDLKMPPWDLIELERDADQSVGQVVVVRPCGGDGRMAPRANIVDCSVDLKLGGFGDFRPGKNSWTDNPLQMEQQQQQPPAASVMPSSTPPKRPRPPSTGPQIASCSVDGCEADLSKCREYHRRHKVCEVHSKTPVVTVRGREQRFCQQCSRFHLLTEFDDVKRSCRKRLDGHNKRRRKPQPNSLKTGNLYPGHQGSMFTMSPQLFPVSAPEQSWSGTVKSEDIIYRQCTSPQLMDRDFCFTNSYCYNKQGKQFPFLQKSDTILSSKNMLGTCQTPLTTISLSGSNGDGSSKMFSHVVTPVFRSDCALSLLSSPTQTSGINMIHMVPPTDRIPMGQPLISNSHCAAAANLSPSAASKSVSHTGFPCSVMEDGAIFVSDDNASNVRCQSIFNVGVEGSSDGTLQMLPFSWN